MAPSSSRSVSPDLIYRHREALGNRLFVGSVAVRALLGLAQRRNRDALLPSPLPTGDGFDPLAVCGTSAIEQERLPPAN